MGKKLTKENSGIAISGNKILLKFSHDKHQYRLTTTLQNTPQNIIKAKKTLSALRLDLERGHFYLPNYYNIFVNPEKLAPLDAHYERNKLQISLGTLLLEQYKRYEIAYKNKVIAYGTLVQYRGIIFRHLLPFFESIQLNELDVSTIEKFISNLSLSKKRLSAIFTPLRVLLNKAKKQGLIQINPLEQLEQSDINTYSIPSDYEIEPFNSTEKDNILSVATGQMKNIIQFAFWTGMRVGEIFALNWSDINFDNETVSINKTKSLGQEIKTTKTKSGIREIELTPLALLALKEQFKFTGEKYDTVFNNPLTNKAWSKPDVFRRHWKKVLSKAKVKYRNPHQIRHTFISYMLSVGNRPEVLYKMVGHINTEMIYRVYGKFIEGEKKGKILVV